MRLPPFRRIGQHLDTRPNAKANALGRRLKSAEVNPELCTFEMIAIGPIFDEQHTESAHYPLRDETAALERALAEELKRRGYDVLGTHQCSGQPNSELLKQVLEKVDRLFPSQQVEVARFPRYQPIQLRGDGPSASEIIMRDRGRL